MEIHRYMKKDVKTCEEGVSVAIAVKKMAKYSIGSLIVVKEDKPVGIFTERDLVKRVIALGKDPVMVRIGDVMTRELITVDANKQVGDVFQLLIKQDMRHLPVVQAGNLVGIVSRKNIAKVMASILPYILSPTRPASG